MTDRGLRAVTSLLLAALAALPFQAAAAGEDSTVPHVFVVEKDAAKLPYADGGNRGNGRRMRDFLNKLPDGYKARIYFVTRAPGGEAITYVERMTPLNPQGKADGTELWFGDWYRQPYHLIPFKNGLRQGVERLYQTHEAWDDKTKRITSVWYVQAEIPWENDKLHGVKKTFHPDGKLASQSPYVRGAISGEGRSYTQEGKLYRIARYKGGKKHGDLTDYWPRNGKVKRVIPYNTGRVHGVAREFYFSGKPKWERPFRDNLQHGIERHWEEDGSEVRTRYWVNGEMVPKEEFDKAFKP